MFSDSIITKFLLILTVTIVSKKQSMFDEVIKHTENVPITGSPCIIAPQAFMAYCSGATL